MVQVVRCLLAANLLFILWDASLHLVQLLHIQRFYPLYPTFPNQTAYDTFWGVSWLMVAIMIGIALLLLRRKHGIQ